MVTSVAYITGPADHRSAGHGHAGDESGGGGPVAGGGGPVGCFACWLLGLLVVGLLEIVPLVMAVARRRLSVTVTG